MPQKEGVVVDGQRWSIEGSEIRQGKENQSDSSSRRQVIRTHSLRQIIVGRALAGLSTVLLALAFSPYNLGRLVWLGFIPMLIAQHRLLPPKLSGLAPAAAIGGWLGFLNFL